MKKHIGISLFFMGCFLSLSATNYFVATNGDDSNAGRATLTPACSMAVTSCSKIEIESFIF